MNNFIKGINYCFQILQFLQFPSELSYLQVKFFLLILFGLNFFLYTSLALLSFNFSSSFLLRYLYSPLTPFTFEISCSSTFIFKLPPLCFRASLVIFSAQKVSSLKVALLSLFIFDRLKPLSTKV